MKKTYSPLKSIRKTCIDCAETWAKVKICNADKDNGSIEKDLLFPFGLGKTVKEMSRIKAELKQNLYRIRLKEGQMTLVQAINYDIAKQYVIESFNDNFVSVSPATGK